VRLASAPVVGAVRGLVRRPMRGAVGPLGALHPATLFLGL
jgi:hypothetical protein